MIAETGRKIRINIKGKLRFLDSIRFDKSMNTQTDSKSKAKQGKERHEERQL